VGQIVYRTLSTPAYMRVLRQAVVRATRRGHIGSLNQAVRLIAVSFFALAGYVTVQTVFDLASRSEPDTSTVGIALAAVSLVVMPLLAALKRRNGRRLGSSSVVADSNQTMLCTYLSAVLLVGLLLNATVGWWWADPVAALVIAALAINEGREASHGERCCDDDACAA
jgi:divalent metal cation (Fe/Co/Zn/Cd) transporter